VTTVVRPTEADLIAISRRIGGPLSPEGAENWYRNDGALLLQEISTLRREIVTLRQEAEAARRSFYEDGAEAAPDATLHDWALAWKATATGFWQKTQTKALREEAASQRIAAANYKDSLAAAEELNQKYVAETTDLALQVNELRQERDALQHKAEGERAMFLKRIGELDRLLAQTQEEAVQARGDAERNIEMIRARHAEQMVHVKELARRTMDAL
jgi:hypothetical protein